MTRRFKLIIIIGTICIAQYATAQFGPRIVIDSTLYGITEIISVDLNNDSFSDIVISQKYNFDRVSFFLNNGDGSFGDVQIVKEGITDPMGITSADFNDDGWVDIVTASTSFVNDTNTLYLLKNNAGSGFIPLIIDTQVSPTSKIIKMRAADVDNDGDEDIVAISDGNLLIYYNDGVGNFSKTTVSPGIITEYYELQVEDINNDGFKDVVAGGIKTLIYINTNGMFSYDTLRSASVVNQGLIFLVNLKDFDGDGDNDLLISGNNGSDLRWYSNDGDGFFTLQHVFQTNITQCNSLSSNDFNGDGKIDLFTGFPQTGKVVWYENMGDGIFSTEKLIFLGNIPFTKLFYSDDFDNDGKFDIVWAEELSFHKNVTTTGLNEIRNSPKVKLYPNPASNFVNIYSELNCSLQVFNTKGEVVINNLLINVGENNIAMDIKSGLYILVFTMENQTFVKKLLIK